MNDAVNHITAGLPNILPEIVLAASFLIILVVGFFKPGNIALSVLTILAFALSIILILPVEMNGNVGLFGMLQLNPFAKFLKILADVGGIFTVILSLNDHKEHRSEFLAFLLVVALGCHLLMMTSNFLIIFISIEMISIGSYVLAGYSFTKSGTEGSLKYFLFGAVASAVMLYGFSILYGLTGSIDFGLPPFVAMVGHAPAQTVVGCFFVLAGFLYKIAAFPMHVWSPDVYEAAPLPVLAFLSVVPKLAGFAVLIKFASALRVFGPSLNVDWQMVIAFVSILTITVGNFSALQQTSAKRMLAYSSIAHAGFLLVPIASFSPSSEQAFLFYASIYLLMNFGTIACLQFFERLSFKSFADFAGAGRNWLLFSVMLLVGLVALTGLPPTAGFTAKLFIFSSLWEAYQTTDKAILLVLLIFGLGNTVVSLFYYLRIPYFAFLKGSQPVERQNIVTFENLFAGILVVLILVLFFLPGLLMGWINKINFVA